MIIEHHTFRLADGVDEDSFLAADRRVQQELAPFQAGFVRRTTARGAHGEWLVETLWASLEDAEAAMGSDDPAQQAFLDLVDPASSAVRRWSTLD